MSIVSFDFLRTAGQLFPADKPLLLFASGADVSCLCWHHNSTNLAHKLREVVTGLIRRISKGAVCDAFIVSQTRFYFQHLFAKLYSLFPIRKSNCSPFSVPPFPLILFPSFHFLQNLPPQPRKANSMSRQLHICQETL